MTAEQKNLLGARLLVWLLIAAIILWLNRAVLTERWTNWNVLYLAGQALFFVCVFHKIVLLEQPVARCLPHVREAIERHLAATFTLAASTAATIGLFWLLPALLNSLFLVLLVIPAVFCFVVGLLAETKGPCFLAWLTIPPIAPLAVLAPYLVHGGESGGWALLYLPFVMLAFFLTSGIATILGFLFGRATAEN